MLDQQVQDLNCSRPSMNRTKRKQLDLPKRPMCQDQSNPLESAPRREIWVLTVVVSCSDAP